VQAEFVLALEHFGDVESDHQFVQLVRADGAVAAAGPDAHGLLAAGGDALDVVAVAIVLLDRLFGDLVPHDDHSVPVARDDHVLESLNKLQAAYLVGVAHHDFAGAAFEVRN